MELPSTHTHRGVFLFKHPKSIGHIQHEQHECHEGFIAELAAQPTEELSWSLAAEPLMFICSAGAAFLI